jgi:uncharacterized protein YbjT (DUF2867 family)
LLSFNQRVHQNDQMKSQTVTIIGSTGLIGGLLLEILKADPAYDVIKVIVRRPVSFNHPKVKVNIIDFTDGASYRNAIAGSDAVFCAVGTTNRKVNGDKAAYRKIDFDIPVDAARYCEETGCGRYLLVSSVGASSSSGNFYLKLKGEVEDAISQMSINSISIFRPSFLIGERPEIREGEKLAKLVSTNLSFLFPSRFKPIQAYDVARSMVAASVENIPGIRIYQYSEMKNLITA